MDRKILTLTLVFSIACSLISGQVRAEENYPLDFLGLTAGVFSGQTWVNLAPLVPPSEVISPQIYPVRFGSFLLAYDLLLKEECKRILALPDEIEGTFRVWLEVASVKERVRFRIKVEGMALPKRFFSALDYIVNEGEEFYPLRRAVYWFYEGRRLRECLGLKGFPTNDTESLRQAIGFLQWEYLKDWVGDEKGPLVGGIVLPDLLEKKNMGDLPVESFLQWMEQIEKDSTIPSEEKIAFFLKSVFSSEEGEKILDVCLKKGVKIVSEVKDLAINDPMKLMDLASSEGLNFETIVRKIFARDPDQAETIISNVKERIQTFRLEGSKHPRKRKGKSITRRSFLKFLGMGLGGVLLGGVKIWFDGKSRSVTSGPAVKGGKVADKEVIEKKEVREQEEKKHEMSVLEENKVSPKEIRERIEKILKSKKLSKDQVSEVVNLFDSLFDEKGKLVIVPSEFRRLLNWAGSKDVSLAKQLFDRFSSLIGKNSVLGPYLPSGEGIEECKKLTLEIVEKASANVRGGYLRRKRFRKTLNRYTKRLLGTEISQDFFCFLKNPFWVYPMLLAQRYMAERGIYYSLDTIMAFAIKEGYDRVGAKMRRGKWRGDVVTNKWPIGLDRFGSGQVRKILVEKGWLPYGFIKDCVVETGKFMNNRREVFPVVQFVSDDPVLGGEYSAFLAMISMIKQDQEEMFRRFPSIKKAWSRLGDREKIYLLYLFYSCPVREEARIVRRIKDLLIYSSQDLPGWLMAKRLNRGREKIQHWKAVKTVAIAESLLLFLPVDKAKGGERRFSEMRNYLSGFLGLGLSRKSGGTYRGKEENEKGRVEVDSILEKVRVVLEKYVGKETGFVEEFKETTLYSVLKNFSEEVLEDPSKAETTFDTCLFPIFEKGQRVLFYDNPKAPRWRKEKYQNFVVENLGDYFLYRLASVHSFPNLRRCGIETKNGIEFSEDLEKYKERLKEFLFHWIITMRLVHELVSIAEYLERPIVESLSEEMRERVKEMEKMKFYLNSLKVNIPLSDSIESLEQIELFALKPWKDNDYIGRIGEIIFAQRGLERVSPITKGESFGSKVMVGRKGNDLYLYLPILPSIAERYGNLSGGDAVKKIRDYFLEYGKNMSYVWNNIQVWTGSTGESWCEDSDYLWKAGAEWVKAEEVGEEVWEIHKAGFDVVAYIKGSDGRYAFLIQRKESEEQEEKEVDRVQNEFGISFPEEVEKEWEKALFLGFLGIGKKNIAFVGNLSALGLVDNLGRVKEIKSLAENLQGGVKSQWGIILN